jgi:hypothetical protein
MPWDGDIGRVLDVFFGYSRSFSRSLWLLANELRGAPDDAVSRVADIIYRACTEPVKYCRFEDGRTSCAEVYRYRQCRPFNVPDIRVSNTVYAAPSFAYWYDGPALFIDGRVTRDAFRLVLRYLTRPIKLFYFGDELDVTVMWNYSITRTCVVLGVIDLLNNPEALARRMACAAAVLAPHPPPRYQQTYSVVDTYFDECTLDECTDDPPIEYKQVDKSLEVCADDHYAYKGEGARCYAQGTRVVCL